MERQRNGQERPLVRCCEVNRLQSQVLALAYEQIWPLLQRVVKETRPDVSVNGSELSIAPVPVARSA